MEKHQMEELCFLIGKTCL